MRGDISEDWILERKGVVEDWTRRESQLEGKETRRNSHGVWKISFEIPSRPTSTNSNQSPIPQALKTPHTYQPRYNPSSSTTTRGCAPFADVEPHSCGVVFGTTNDEVMTPVARRRGPSTSPLMNPRIQICSIIPLANICRSVHLFPKFGPFAPQEWTSSNVLDLCNTFFVNDFTDRHMYRIAC